MLLIDDGKLRMRVIEVDGKSIVAEVAHRRRHVEPQGHQHARHAAADQLHSPKKDRVDLDSVAQTRGGLDRAVVRAARRRHHRSQEDHRRAGAVLAKIEKPSAIDDIDDIIAAGDGFMVARGDLGVEMPVERVPGLQKQITRKARGAGKPIVVATQMLESMTTSPMPTRAEVSDVATAVFDGADAIMLSGESAVGQYPVETIEMMNRIARSVEIGPELRRLRACDRSAEDADRRRRDRGGRACHLQHAQGGRHSLLHGDRFDGAARRA